MCRSHLGHPESSREFNLGISSSLHLPPIFQNPNLKCFIHENASPVLYGQASFQACAGSPPSTLAAYEKSEAERKVTFYQLSACGNLMFFRCLVIIFTVGREL